MKADLKTILCCVAVLVLVLIIYNCVENFQVAKVVPLPCKCVSCQDACYNRALTGELYGCDSKNLNPDECEYSYRMCLLTGCGIAGSTTPK